MNGKKNLTTNLFLKVLVKPYDSDFVQGRQHLIQVHTLNGPWPKSWSGVTALPQGGNRFRSWTKKVVWATICQLLTPSCPFPLTSPFPPC